MKLNRFVCPNCGHEWFEDASYSSCDVCLTHFYLDQSAEVASREVVDWTPALEIDWGSDARKET